MIFKRPVDGALYMYVRGFKVFPLRPDKKIPALKDWQAWAQKAEEKIIKQYATANPSHNWGVLCGNGVGVIDLDNKPTKDRDGITAIKHLIQSNGKLPKTLTVLTPTKGKHLYYKSDELPNTVNGLAKGIDTRGLGGYVVAPGSRSGQSVYEIEIEHEISELPAWVLTNILQKKKEKTIIEEGADVIEGERNNVLTSIAGTMREAGLSFEAILSALEITNSKSVNPPLPQHEIVNIAKSIARYKPGTVKAAQDFDTLTPRTFKTFNASEILPSTLPKRDWVMKNRYISRFISVLISRGGVGKSTFSMLDAISIATGRNLTGEEVIKPGAVWIYNTEDPSDELARRMAAIAQHYEIPLEELSNIHLTSGRESPLLLAKTHKSAVVKNQKAIDAIVSYIQENKIQLFIADPFVRTHAVNENDNMQIDKVVAVFNEIAERSGAAVSVIHHERKLSSREVSTSGDSNRGRGASSLTDGVRVAHTIDTMTEKEAKNFGLNEDDRRFYIRIDTAKSNMSAPADKATWFKKCTVELPNGDTVGSLKYIDVDTIKLSGEKAPSVLDAERQDVAWCLAQIMSPSSTLLLIDVRDILLTDPKYSHLFGTGLLNEQHAYRKLRTLFAKPIDYENIRFSMTYMPDKDRPHGKALCIKCEDITIQNMLD